MKAFSNQYKLKSLNKEPTCFKYVNNPSCIDSFLINNSKFFEDCLTLETGLSDFTIIKTKLERFPPKIVNFRDYKNFDTRVLKDRLELTLKSTTSFEELQETYMDLLNKFAPLKFKYLRANHSKIMTKELSKALMFRTRFRNQFLKMKTPEAKAKYNKQRSICVSLTRKAKRNYYGNVDLNNICNNKKFWATVKPLFSKKIKSAENKKTKKKLLTFSMIFS